MAVWCVLYAGCDNVDEGTVVLFYLFLEDDSEDDDDYLRQGSKGRLLCQQQL